MKKLIALTLMVACLACFSIGCPGGEKEKPTSSTPPPTSTPDPSTDAPVDTPAAAPADAPATE